MPQLSVFVLIPLLFAEVASATTVVRASLDDLVQVSAVVVHGVVRQVDDQLATSLTGPFRTEVEIEVLEPVKGYSHPTLRLELPGGRGYGRIMRIPGMPQFVPGDEIVVFLESLVRGGYALTGLAQGVFKVDRRGTEARVVRDLHGVSVVDDRGQHDHALLVMPETLAELLTFVRQSAVRP